VATNYAVGNVTHDISTLPVMVRKLYSTVRYGTEDNCPSVLAPSAVERVSSKTRLLGEEGGWDWGKVVEAGFCQCFRASSDRFARGWSFDFDGVELVTSVPSPPFFRPPAASSFANLPQSKHREKPVDGNEVTPDIGLTILHVRSGQVRPGQIMDVLPS
jgi:hypothetical protein